MWSKSFTFAKEFYSSRLQSWGDGEFVREEEYLVSLRAL